MDGIVKPLRGTLAFADRFQSYAPHYSRVGLALADTLGAGTTAVCYNRKVTVLAERILEVLLSGEPIAVEESANDPVGVLRSGTRGSLVTQERLVGIECDTYRYEVELANRGQDTQTVDLAFGGNLRSEPGFPLAATYDPEFRTLQVAGPFKRGDDRDPAPSFDIAFALVLPRQAIHLEVGAAGAETAQPLQATVEGDTALRIALAPFDLAEGESITLRFTFAFGLGADSAHRRRDEAIAASAISSEDAHSATVKWLHGATCDLFLPAVTGEIEALYARCVYTLVANTIEPHERFRPYRAVFPSRGTYASHYLWDACFQALGYQYINRDVTAESLWLLVARQEADGKIPQFACATWNRPGAAQPPLIAWAATSLESERRHSQVYPVLYEPLCRWNAWWFARRDEDRDGLCEYIEALESGWDNSPRWDHGRVEPLDLNSFLLLQMEALATIAEALGRSREAQDWRQKAADHGQRIVDGLYHEGDGIFYDRIAETKQPIKIKTPASFLPLWAGAPLPEADARASIERYLLDPDHFFGPYPFPVVAYNEPTYEPGGWWRGPVWPNIAYLMTEVLRRYGYEAERREAIRRLVAMIQRSASPHELYDSQTGQPKGASELGWTAAVTMLWIQDMAQW